MARSFDELRNRMPAERQKSARQRARTILGELALAELRQSLHLSQADLARELDVNQPALSKLERRNDMFISSLRRLIGAMGGELVLLARFPEGDVVLDQFVDPLSRTISPTEP